jgi:long-chain fatty acid transport protein
MNTSYAADSEGRNLLGGSGKLGVDMSQLIVAPTLAYKLDENHAVGASPLLVYQRFAARGLQAFANMPGMSSSPGNVTNQGYDSSTGVGLRLGYQGQIGQGLRVGAAWSPRVEMGRFEQYQGLFAGQGGFDLPENLNLGVAWQTTPALLLALDYQRIHYSGVASVGNSSQVQAQLGSDNGRGFGWRDIEVWKLGAQWQYSADWTLRAGVNRGQNPVTAPDVTFNMLAPGVMTTHWTLGATYRLSDSDELSFSYMRAPEQSVSGVSMFDNPAFGGPGNGSVRETIRMKQQLIGVQFSRKF